MTLPDPPILVITDRRHCAQPLEARAEALFQGGCRWLSVREKDLEPSERRALLRRLVAIGRGHGALVGVHGDIEAAAALGIPLHLPASADARTARVRLGVTAFIGQSCHNAAALASAAAGACYATLSPLFDSASKPGYRSAFDIGDLAAITDAASLPVIGLGGITAGTLPDLAGSGLSGVATMGEAMRTAGPAAWFARLTETWRALAVSR